VFLTNEQQPYGEYVRSARTCLKMSKISFCLLYFVVRGAINVSRSINRLPPEILVHIFNFVPSSPRSRDESASSLIWPSLFDFKDVNSLLGVTHVCRRWRDIALGSSTLWTTIDEHSHHAAASAYVERSRETSLKILVNSYTHPFIKGIYQSASARISTLYHRSHYGAVVNSLNFAAERLEAFGLEILAGVGSLSSYSAAPLLFDGKAPRLKVLVLSRVPWLPANRFSTLTHLSISENFVMTLSGLLDFLSGTPYLLDLIIMSSRVIETEVTQKGPTVNLNCLRRLAMGKVDAAFVSCFLSHVALPSHMALRLFDLDTDLRSDMSFLQSLPHIPLIDDLDKLSLTVHTHEGEAIFTVIAAGPSSAFRLDWRITLYWHGGRQYRSEWARTLLAALPIRNVKEFWVDGPPNIGDILQVLLASMPALTTLVVNDRDRHLVEHIFRILTTSLITPPNQLHCPDLSVLRVREGKVHLGDMIEFYNTRARFVHPLKQILVSDTSLIVPRFWRLTLDDWVKFLPADTDPSMSLPSVCTAGRPSSSFWPDAP